MLLIDNINDQHLLFVKNSNPKSVIEGMIQVVFHVVHWMILGIFNVASKTKAIPFLGFSGLIISLIIKETCLPSKDRNGSMFCHPRSSTVTLILSIHAIIVSITQVMVINAESSVTASMMCLVWTDVIAGWFIFSSIAVYFSIASIRVGDTLFSTLKAWRVQWSTNSSCNSSHSPSKSSWDSRS